MPPPHTPQPKSAAQRLRDFRDRASWFVQHRMWDVDIDQLPRARTWAYRATRIIYSAVRGAAENHLPLRAAGMTYFTVLSVVPFLASAFALLKGFGAHHELVQETLRPWIHVTFSGNPQLERAIETVLAFVESTDVSRLGALGLLLLVYTSVSLLANIEGVLNAIWGAKHKRPRLRQLTDYVTLLVTTPLLVLVAISLVTAASSSNMVGFLRETLALGPVIDFLLRLTSLVIACVAMFAVYMIMPNARVRVSSAAIGGVVSGIAWQLLLLLHVRFQIGVARYNALYAGFGAIPIFLVWTFTSWLIVFWGAALAASHQNEAMTKQRFRARHIDQQLREDVAVAVVALLARDFLQARPCRTTADLAAWLGFPATTLSDILDTLVAAGVLVKVVIGRDIGYAPAHDPDGVFTEDVREALRLDPLAEALRTTFDRQVGSTLAVWLADWQHERRNSRHNVNLRALANLAPAHACATASPALVREKPSTPGDRVFDAKQPDLS